MIEFPVLRFLFLALVFAPFLNAEERKPNLLVFMTDDHGYGDVGCFGSERVKTPRLDQLAAEGVRCTAFYGPASVCSPTRAGMLTGRSPFRLGIYNYIPGNSPMHLQRSEITLGTLLRDAGYDTCFVGKWAVNSLMGSSRQPQPVDHGFDYSFASQNNASPSHLNPTCFYRNGEPAPVTEGYSSAIIVDEAIQWLARRKDTSKPFCLFVWFHEPHRVIATPKAFAVPYEGKEFSPVADDLSEGQKDMPTVAEYLGNIAHVDYQIGRLLGALKAAGDDTNTFTLFTSDNGPISPGSAGPLRGGKGTLWEGGIRMPGIVRWPGHIEPGSTIDTPVSGLDLLPTFCAIVGIAPPRDRAIDGENILPVLEGHVSTRTKPLFWWRPAGEVALREGDWKIRGITQTSKGFPSKIAWYKKAKIEKFELYNLREDLAEQHDVAKQHPETIAALAPKLVKLYTEMQREAPVWDEKAFHSADRESEGGKKKRKG